MLNVGAALIAINPFVWFYIGDKMTVVNCDDNDYIDLISDSNLNFSVTLNQASDYYIWDYFITINELRRNKILKIKERINEL